MEAGRDVASLAATTSVRVFSHTNSALQGTEYLGPGGSPSVKPIKHPVPRQRYYYGSNAVTRLIEAGARTPKRRPLPRSHTQLMSVGQQFAERNLDFGG